MMSAMAHDALSLEEARRRATPGTLERLLLRVGFHAIWIGLVGWVPALFVAELWPQHRVVVKAAPALALLGIALRVLGRLRTAPYERALDLQRQRARLRRERAGLDAADGAIDELCEALDRSASALRRQRRSWKALDASDAELRRLVDVLARARLPEGGQADGAGLLRPELRVTTADLEALVAGLDEVIALLGPDPTGHGITLSARRQDLCDEIAHRTRQGAEGECGARRAP